MSPHDEIQEKGEAEAQELLGALNRVTLGMGGAFEALVLARALGLDGFTYRGDGDDDE